MKPKIYIRSEHTVSRKNIDTDALKIMHRLIRNGFKGYLVGGGVRDLLLNRKPKDFDIATDATPKQVKLLFRNSRIIGKRFKLAHIFFKDGKIIEVSTFRDLKEVDAENVKTLERDNFYGTEETDAMRRDISINALYYDLNTFSIIDYVGGFKDLQRQVVRIIGNPTIKIIEDPVRLWRAIRHTAKCGFKLETESKKAIVENKDLINQIPTMRIHDELKKDFCSGYSYEIFKLAEKLKVLELIFPELSKPSTNLNNKENESSLALIFIDSLILKGLEVPITAVLAVLCISIKKSLEKNKHYNELFESENDIDDFEKTLFTKFFVPKKEKEIIFTAIKLWKKVLSKKPNEISAKSLARRVPLVELKYLIWFTNNDETLINTINEALKLKSRDKKVKDYRSEIKNDINILSDNKKETFKLKPKSKLKNNNIDKIKSSKSEKSNEIKDNEIKITETKEIETKQDELKTTGPKTNEQKKKIKIIKEDNQNNEKTN